MKNSFFVSFRPPGEIYLNVVGIPSFRSLLHRDNKSKGEFTSYPPSHFDGGRNLIILTVLVLEIPLLAQDHEVTPMRRLNKHNNLLKALPSGFPGDYPVCILLVNISSYGFFATVRHCTPCNAYRTVQLAVTRRAMACCTVQLAVTRRAMAYRTIQLGVARCAMIVIGQNFQFTV
jgi:hypothetical protein